MKILKKTSIRTKASRTIASAKERFSLNFINLNKKYADKIPFTEYFRQLGILIPDFRNGQEPNLNIASLIDERDKISSYIQQYANQVSFIVIHLGILEKLLLDKGETNKMEGYCSVIKNGKGATSSFNYEVKDKNDIKKAADEFYKINVDFIKDATAELNKVK